MGYVKPTNNNIYQIIMFSPMLNLYIISYIYYIYIYYI